MDVMKAREFQADLEAEVKLLQDTINNLKKLIAASTSGKKEQKNSAGPLFIASSDSYIDLAVKVISANKGEPMRMNAIVEGIRSLKNNPDIARRSVESTLIQHARAKGDMSRVKKIRRGVWGLRRFPREREETLTAAS